MTPLPINPIKKTWHPVILRGGVTTFRINNAIEESNFLEWQEKQSALYDEIRMDEEVDEPIYDEPELDNQ
jgi:hypothetical protein